MPNLIDLAREVKSLAKEEKFQEALNCFKKHYVSLKSDIPKNEYLIADVLKCLRKTNQAEKTFGFLEQLGLEITMDRSDVLLNGYGWVLYDLLKNESSKRDSFEEDNYDSSFILNEEPEVYEVAESSVKEPLKEKLLEIVPLLIYDNQYSPLKRLLTKVVKAEKAKNRVDWKFLNTFLDQFDYNNLNTVTESINVQIKGREKEIELASDKENWFVGKARTLFKIGEFEECISISKLALDSIEKFHYNNGTWVLRWIALSYKELGRIDDAIDELQIVKKRKKEWFIFSELGELYLRKQDYNVALQYMVFGVLSYGDLDKKVGLLYNVGLALKQKQENQKALEHFILTKMIREEQGWKIRTELTDEIQTLIQQGCNGPDFEFSLELFNSLHPFWLSITPEFKFVNSKQLKGEVTKLDKRKGYGFIKIESGESFYFKVRKFRGDINKLNMGAIVKFKLKAPIDLGKSPGAKQVFFSK